MATISTDTFLDTATGTRTAGEQWTVNGCTFTIRTDTRWYSGAPSGMTGSLGIVSCSSSIGGTIVIDGTSVRWMPFDSGSDVVPPIGTMITQGVTSGYLLGVWPDLASAPLSPGSAMPATGYLKFREVTGSFTSGVLGGISASATSSDVTGWIEVVGESTFGTGYFGTSEFKGDWFYLGETSGVRGQTFQVPTNGGGENTHSLGIQIETSPGSNEYEWYSSASSTLANTVWTSTKMGTDARSKFVENVGNGVVRIGSNGTIDLGYLPPAGCKVRIPNVILRATTSASRSTNLAPTRGPAFTLNLLNSYIDCVESQAGNSYTTATSAVWKRYINQAEFTFNDLVTISLDDVCLGAFASWSHPVGLARFNNLSSGTFNKVKFIVRNDATEAVKFTDCRNLSLTGCEVVHVERTYTSTAKGISFDRCEHVQIGGIATTGVSLDVVNGSDDVVFKNYDYCDRLIGTTNSTGQLSCVNVTSSSNVLIDGVTFGKNGQIPNVQPGLAIANAFGLVRGLSVRNLGNRYSPLNSGNASFSLPYVISGSAGVVSGAKIQRVFLTRLIGGIAQASKYWSGLVIDDVHDLSRIAVAAPFGKDALIRKVGGKDTTSTIGGVGTHWFDIFTSDTEGTIIWQGSAPSPNTSGSNYLVLTPSKGSGYVVNRAELSLDTKDDYAFSETQYWIKGHTGFRNLAYGTVGTWTGISVYYDINNGSGFRENWTLATGSNLSAETLNPDGFKMRIKLIQTGTTNTSTSLGYLKIYTTTSVQAQADYVNPLDTNTLTLTGLVAGSEVRCYEGTDPLTSVEIGGTESSVGSSFSFSHSSGGKDGYIVVLAMGYQPIRIPYTFKASDESILIQPVIDRNYANP